MTQKEKVLFKSGISFQLEFGRLLFFAILPLPTLMINVYFYYGIMIFFIFLHVLSIRKFVFFEECVVIKYVLLQKYIKIFYSDIVHVEYIFIGYGGLPTFIVKEKNSSFISKISHFFSHRFVLYNTKKTVLLLVLLKSKNINVKINTVDSMIKIYNKELKKYENIDWEFNNK